MKTWLIDNFGSVKGVADTQLKAIKSLKAPRSGSDHSGQACSICAVYTGT